LARDFGGFAGSSCVLYGQSNSDIADFFSHARGELAGTAAAGCGIHDG
jgi:hypothetical protein